jgi:drug/metabolite transporter (DMT)-like permease
MRTRKTYALFALVCAIFGTTFLAIRMGLDAGASPLFYAGLRFVIAGVALTAVLFATGRLTLRTTLALASRSALLSLFLTVGTFGLMFVAETQVDSGLMARLDAAGPLFTALFATLFLGKRLSLAHMLAFTLGMAGTMLMASPASFVGGAYLAAAMGSVVVYAAGNALYPRLFGRGEDPISVSALQTLIGGLILLAASPLLEAPVFPSAALAPLLYLAFAGSVVAHTATLILVRDAGPVFASSWLYVAPVVATFAGAVVLSEGIAVPGMIGTTLALVGVFVMDRAER